MQLYRYKAKFTSEQESEAAFWYMRITTLVTLMTSVFWVKFTDSYYCLLAGFIIGLFAYSALSISKLRPVYYVLNSLVVITAFISFIVSVYLSFHYSYVLISVVSLAYGIIHLALGFICFHAERAVI